jgi:aromatic-L-amino-acid/L-tryptophan decarboxylase
MSGFRDDAAATTDWIAGYLEGVRDLPVLAQVEPGQIRDALPAAPPHLAT